MSIRTKFQQATIFVCTIASLVAFGSPQQDKQSQQLAVQVNLNIDASSDHLQQRESSAGRRKSNDLFEFQSQSAQNHPQMASIPLSSNSAPLKSTIKTQPANQHNRRSLKYVLKEPEWMEQLQSQTVKVGESFIYDMGVPENIYYEPMQVSVKLGSASRFTSFEQRSNTLYIHGALDQFAGSYPIRVRAKTVTDEYSESYEREFDLIVEPKEVEEPDLVELQKIEEEKNRLPANNYNLPIWEDTILNELVAEPFSDSKPIPYMADLTLAGVLVIGWDTWMAVPPGNFSNIEDTKIATVYQESLKSEQKITVWDEQELSPKDLSLVDSISIYLEDGNSQQMTLIKWAILSFDKDFIKLMLELPEPDLISRCKLRVTFWGVDFFRSEKGEAVRQGTTLHWKVFRQASDQSIDEANDYSWLYVLQLVLMLLFVPYFLVSNRMLSFFMFFNSLQLMTYLVMLDTQMPPSVVIFLKSYLNLVRLKIPGTDVDLNDVFDQSRRSQMTKDADIYSHENTLLQLFGYRDFFFNNAPLLLGMFGFFLVLYAVAAVKDRLPLAWRKKLPLMLRPNHEMFLSNFLLRFFFMAFLEITICVLISLQRTNLSSPNAILQWIVSLCFLAGIVALFTLLAFKFVRNGPYLQKYYNPLTLDSLCCWSSRPMNPSYDYSRWFKKYQKHRINRNRDLEELRLLSNANKDRSKPQHRIKIKGNQCQPVNQIEEPASATQRHLLDTAEQQSDAPEMRNIPISIQMIEEEKSSTNVFQSQSGGKTTKELTIVEETPKPSSPITIQEGTPYQSQAAQVEQIHLQIKKQPVSESRKEDKECYEGGGKEGETSNNTVTAVTLLTDTQTGVQNNNAPIVIQQQSQPQQQVQSVKKPPPSKPFSSQYAKDLLKLRIRQKAIIKLMMEKTVQVSPRTSTIFSGLKLNHQRNVAIVHPIMYLVRRLFLAITIVFMQDQGFQGLFLTMGCSFVMLAYVVIERQWSDHSILQQHIANEVVLYILTCLMLFFCQIETTLQARQTVGTCFVAVFLICSLSNLVLIICQILKYIKLLLKRRFKKQLRSRLAKQVVRKMKLINKILFVKPIEHDQESAADADQSDSENLKPWFKPAASQIWDISEIKYQMKPKRTAYGGLQGTFILSEKPLSFDHISSIRDLEQSKFLTPRHVNNVTDFSLVELHRDLQQMSFDNALQDHARWFLSHSPRRQDGDTLSLWSRSRFTPERRQSRQNEISNNQWYSADSLSSPSNNEDNDNDNVPSEYQSPQLLQVYQSRRDQKDVDFPPQFNLQVVPELTLEESQIIAGKKTFMSPRSRKDLTQGRNNWAMKAFLQPTADAKQAVQLLQREQQLNTQRRQSTGRDQISSWKSSHQSELQMVTPLHNRLFCHQSNHQSNAGKFSSGSNQLTAKFTLESNSTQLRKIELASSLQTSVKDSYGHQNNLLSKLDEMDETRIIKNNNVVEGRKKEASFSMEQSQSLSKSDIVAARGKMVHKSLISTIQNNQDVSRLTTDNGNVLNDIGLSRVTAFQNLSSNAILPQVNQFDQTKLFEEANNLTMIGRKTSTQDDLTKSPQNNRVSCSPERHEHQSNNQSNQPYGQEDKSNKCPSSAMLYGQEAPQNDTSAQLYGNEAPSLNCPSSAMLAKSLIMNANSERAQDICNKGKPRDKVLDYFRRHDAGDQYQDHSWKDPFDIRQNPNLSELQKSQSFHKPRPKREASTSNRSANHNSLLFNNQTMLTDLHNLSKRSVNRANSQDQIQEAIIPPSKGHPFNVQKQPSYIKRNALFKTLGDTSLASAQQEKIQLSRRQVRSSTLRLRGSEIVADRSFGRSKERELSETSNSITQGNRSRMSGGDLSQLRQQRGGPVINFMKDLQDNSYNRQNQFDEASNVSQSAKTMYQKRQYLRNGQKSLEHTTPDASILEHTQNHSKHLQQQPSQILQDYSTINDQMLDRSKNLPSDTQNMMRMSQQSNQVSSSNQMMMLNSDAVKRDNHIFTMQRKSESANFFADLQTSTPLIPRNIGQKNGDMKQKINFLMNLKEQKKPTTVMNNNNNILGQQAQTQVVTADNSFNFGHEGQDNNNIIGGVKGENRLFDIKPVSQHNLVLSAIGELQRNQNKPKDQMIIPPPSIPGQSSAEQELLKQKNLLDAKKKYGAGSLF